MRSMPHTFCSFNIIAMRPSEDAARSSSVDQLTAGCGHRQPDRIRHMNADPHQSASLASVEHMDNIVNIPSSMKPEDGRFGSGPSKIRPEQVDALERGGKTLLGTSHRRRR